MRAGPNAIDAPWVLSNSDVEADVALSRCAPSGPRSLTPVVMQTNDIGLAGDGRTTLVACLGELRLAAERITWRSFLRKYVALERARGGHLPVLETTEDRVRMTLRSALGLSHVAWPIRRNFGNLSGKCGAFVMSRLTMSSSISSRLGRDVCETRSCWLTVVAS